MNCPKCKEPMNKENQEHNHIFVAADFGEVTEFYDDIRTNFSCTSEDCNLVLYTNESV